MRRKPALAETSVSQFAIKKPQRGARKVKRTVKVVRNRRSPEDLIAALEHKRDAVAERMGTLLTKLDERIEGLRERYGVRMEINRLVQEQSVEELESALREAKAKKAVISRALRAKEKAE